MTCQVNVRAQFWIIQAVLLKMLVARLECPALAAKMINVSSTWRPLSEHQIAKSASIIFTLGRT